MKAISIMTASLNRLSFQIVRSLFVVVCVGLLSLVFVGHNAINIADQNARAAGTFYRETPYCRD
jgi:uncharacterized membrane protein affecting hemolysin expression